MNDPALVVDGLDVRYTTRGREVRAVNGVSFAIEAGRCLGLVGESGSGKSTVGLAVQGLLSGTPHVHVTGRIDIAGTRLDPATEDGWARVRGHRVTTVFQDPMTSLDPTMTIRRQLDWATKDTAESLRWLEEMEIRSPKNVLGSYPHQLSGGMRQRVMIALALARHPSVLVADEPTTALDVSVQAQILAILTRERERLGLTLLFVTHDLGVARTMCDDVAVMRNGHLVETGSAADVFDHPIDTYTQRLVSSRLTLDTDRSRPVGPPEASVVTAMSDACGRTEPDLFDRWSAKTLGWDEFRNDRSDDVVRSPALEFAMVTKSFATGGLGRKRRITVLHGIDLRVGPRESVALVGESGSGKSTILRIAAGLEVPDSGDVIVDRRRGEGVQVIFQEAGASLTPWLTIRSLLTERLTNSVSGASLDDAEREARIRLALERVALPVSVLDAKPANLSGGQRQRVAIARAVVVPPSLLLCDEPTSALDVSVACSVLNVLNLLRRDLEVPLLFVTHDLAAARIIADRIDVVSEGRIVERVAAETLTDSMASDYGRKLLDAVPH